MSRKDSIATLTSHFEHLTNCFPEIANLQTLQASGYPLAFKAVYSQRHMREDVAHKSTYNFTFDPNSNTPITQFTSFPTAENDVQVESYSPSKNFRALFRKSGDKVFLEIWGKFGLIKSARVSDLHGAVYNDAQFCLNGIIWSQDERRIAYVAEQKEEKFPKYFDDFGNDEEASKAFKAYEYRQDLGESYRGKVTPIIFLYDINEEQVYRVANVPPEIVPTQISFADKTGNTIVFCGFKFKDVRLGLKFCYNRDSKIYLIKKLVLERTKEDKTKKLTDDEKKAQKEKIKKEGEENKPVVISNDDIAVFPVVDNDLTRVAYLFSPWKVTHTTGLGLKVVDLPKEEAQSTPKLILDIVQEKDEKFAGIMGYHDRLNRTSFIGGSRYLAINSDFKATVGLFIVDTETKEIRKIDKPKYDSEEWKLTTIQDNLVFARIANIEGANKIGICVGFDASANSIDDAIKNIKWHLFELDLRTTPACKSSPQAFLNDIGELEEQVIKHADMESIFYSVKNAKDITGNPIPNNKKPLFIMLHGGPHGTLTGMFTITRYYAFYKGYNMLCPNFKGSTGFGQKYLDELPTKIGQIDVDQIISTIDECIKNGLADPTKLVLFGGSYGGYLPGVIMAKYPEKFKCAIIRNPVMSVGYSYEASDIPEWACSESFNEDMSYEYTGEEMKKMYEISPMGMNKDIKTSILLQLGGKDRRVPCEVGIQYYKDLKQRGVDITLLYYPEDEHSLAGNQETETDQFIQTFLFLEEKMK